MLRPHAAEAAHELHEPVILQRFEQELLAPRCGNQRRRQCVIRADDDFVFVLGKQTQTVYLIL